MAFPVENWIVHGPLKTNGTKWFIFHSHIASTKRAFGMPGHGSPPKYLLDKGMEHVLLPIQAYKSH